MHSYYEKLSFSTTSKQTHNFLGGSANQQSLSTRLPVQFQHRLVFSRCNLSFRQRKAEILTPCIHFCNSLATGGSPSQKRSTQNGHASKRGRSCLLCGTADVKPRRHGSLYSALHLGQNTTDPKISKRSWEQNARQSAYDFGHVIDCRRK